MDRLVEIKQENGLKDDFYVKYLTAKLGILTEEYYSLLNCKSSKAHKIHDYVMLVRKTMIKTKHCLNRAHGIY